MQLDSRSLLPIIADEVGQVSTRPTARGRSARRFMRNRLAVIGAGFVLMMVLLAVFGPVIAPYNSAVQDIADRLRPPSIAHLLGTDEYGRDVLSRLIVGSRVSLAVGVLGVLVVLVIGVTVGMIAGYSKKLDGILMRTNDMFMSIPDFFFLLLLVALFGTGTNRIIFFIGLTSWMATARLIRGQVLRLREQEFVTAARGMGASPGWIVRNHLLANVFDVIMVQATLTVSLVILLESSLSYLGLGAQPPIPSWGNMLSNGRDFMREAWWLTMFPGLAIFFTVMAFNFVGDGIRDALDVQL